MLGGGPARSRVSGPGTGLTNRLRGVVLQKANRGTGYLRGTNQIGYVLLEPEP